MLLNLLKLSFPRKRESGNSPFLTLDSRFRLWRIGNDIYGNNEVGMSKLLIFLVRVYQLTLSPFLGNACRFYPSCSSYFEEAVRQWGAARGTLLGVRRLCKCHPFHPGGIDPVPGREPH